jgi:hypothetical protein
MNKALKGFSKKRFYRKWRIQEYHRQWIARMNAIVIASTGSEQLRHQSLATCKTKGEKITKALAMANTMMNTHVAIARALRYINTNH